MGNQVVTILGEAVAAIRPGALRSNIRRVIHVGPGEFWRAATGKFFLTCRPILNRANSTLASERAYSLLSQKGLMPGWHEAV